MICPKCGKEMKIGAIAQSNGNKWGMFWADNNFFNSKICNFFTAKDAVNEGGIKIKIENGITSDRKTAWACKDCNLVLIDCN